MHYLYLPNDVLQIPVFEKSLCILYVLPGTMVPALTMVLTMVSYYTTFKEESVQSGIRLTNKFKTALSMSLVNC